MDLHQGEVRLLQGVVFCWYHPKPTEVPLGTLVPVFAAPRPVLFVLDELGGMMAVPGTRVKHNSVLQPDSTLDQNLQKVALITR